MRLRVSIIAYCWMIVPVILVSQNLVKNINLGARGSDISDMYATPSGIVFTAYDSDGSRNLYFVSDTTSEPIVLFQTSNIPSHQLIWTPRAVGDSVLFFHKTDTGVALILTDLLTRSLIILQEWSSYSGLSSELGKFTRMGDRIYFITRFANYDFELWSTDGSPMGTQLETLLPNNSFPANLKALSDRLIFTLRGPSFERHLVSYDGSTLTQFFPNANPYGISLVVYNNLVFFSALSDSLGFEPYFSDGTVEGTHLLKDVNPGSGDSFPREFVVSDDTLFFSATDSVNGQELWKSDGTAAGTQLAVDVHVGPDHSWPSSLRANDEQLFFTAFDSTFGRELYVLNHDNKITTRLTDINPGAANTRFDRLIACDGLLYFAAYDSLTGSELYISDGTPGGTLFLKDIFPGSESSGIVQLRNYGGLLYYAADDNLHGQELWISDGTMENTGLRFDINQSEDGSFPYRFKTVLDNNIIFNAKHKNLGFEPHISDGTNQGTFILKDISPGKASSQPRHFTELDGEVFFLAEFATFDQKLYRTDGSVEGTEIAVDERILNDVVKLGDVLVMDVSTIDHGTEPWIYDGDTAFLLKDINATSGSHPTLRMVFEDHLYFTANDGVHGYELWKTDGTTEGTVLFKDLNLGFQGSYQASLTPFDSFFLFSGGVFSHQELFISDGTPEGTYQLKDIYPGSPSGNPIGFYKYNDEIYFRASNTYGSELWKTDGTTEGTAMVKNINPSGSSYPQYFIEAGGKLFFSATTLEHGAELWCTDGTDSGTVMILDIYQGA